MDLDQSLDDIIRKKKNQGSSSKKNHQQKANPRPRQTQDKWAATHKKDKNKARPQQRPMPNQRYQSGSVYRTSTGFHTNKDTYTDKPSILNRTSLGQRSAVSQKVIDFLCTGNSKLEAQCHSCSACLAALPQTRFYLDRVSSLAEYATEEQ